MVTDVLEAEKVTGVPDATLARRHSRWIFVALLFIVLAAALAYVTDNEVRANTQLDRTHATLALTEHHIDTVLANLATVRKELGVVNSQVGAAGTALAQDTAQLQGAQKALANAQANITQQRAMIGNLQTCLGGVEQASNALAVGDQNMAIDALDSVSTNCASAVASGG